MGDWPPGGEMIYFVMYIIQPFNSCYVIKVTYLYYSLYIGRHFVVTQGCQISKYGHALMPLDIPFFPCSLLFLSNRPGDTLWTRRPNGALVRPPVSFWTPRDYAIECPCNFASVMHECHLLSYVIFVVTISLAYNSSTHNIRVESKQIIIFFIFLP